MPQIVDIPGVGQVEFPDGMSESEITQAAQRLHQEAQPQQSRGPRGPLAALERTNPLGGIAAAGTDLALSAMAGLAGDVAGGLNGIVELVKTGDATKAASAVRASQDFFARDPATRGLQTALEKISPTVMRIEEGIDSIAAAGSFGSPAVYAFNKTAMLGGLDAAAGTMAIKRGLRKGAAARNNRLRATELEAAAANLGINLKPSQLRSNVITAAKNLTDTADLDNLTEVQRSLQMADRLAKQRVDEAFEIARSRHAAVRSSDLAQVRASLDDQLRHQGLSKGMPKVSLLLDDIDEVIAKGPDADLAEVMGLRKQAARTAADPEENAARALIRKNLDDFLDNQFHNDMIKGDADALQKWRTANKEASDYFKRFREDKVLADLVDLEASPEQIKRWLLNESAVNPKPMSGPVMRKMKEALGPDHPGFQAIRSEVVMDLTAPLLQPNPNFQAFVRNFDKFVDKRRSLDRSLGVVNDDLRTLRRFAGQAAEAEAALRPVGDIHGMIARAIAGNQLAKATLRQNLLATALRAISGGRTGKQALIREMLGGEFKQPVILPQSFIGTTLMSSAALKELDHAVEESDRKR